VPLEGNQRPADGQGEAEKKWGRTSFQSINSENVSRKKKKGGKERRQTSSFGGGKEVRNHGRKLATASVPKPSRIRSENRRGDLKKEKKFKRFQARFALEPSKKGENGPAECSERKGGEEKKPKGGA